MAMLHNAYKRLTADNACSIVYVGGSITQAGLAAHVARGFPGYRNRVTDYLRKRFPDACVTDRSAAVAGTGSELASLRIERDVLPYAPDLVFIECAVNDDAINALRTLNGMEGLARRIWRELPLCDIVILYAINKGHLYKYAKDEKPNAIYLHGLVAERYGIDAVDMGYDFFTHVMRGGAWEDYMGDDSHPNDAGYAHYARKVNEALDTLLADGPVAPHTLPAPIAPGALEHTRYFPADAIPHAGWADVAFEQWGYAFNALESSAPGASLVFSFTGAEVAVYWFLDMDTGDIEWDIDGGAPHVTPTWDNWVEQAPSRLNYKILATGLEPGEHILTLRATQRSLWARCTGTRIRIMGFMTNE